MNDMYRAIYDSTSQHFLYFGLGFASASAIFFGILSGFLFGARMREKKKQLTPEQEKVNKLWDNRMQ